MRFLFPPVSRKDVRLPVQLQRAMAAEAEASREARAKVIAAEGEQKASRALREASEVIGDSPAALQLRYLQVMSQLKTIKKRDMLAFKAHLWEFTGMEYLFLWEIPSARIDQGITFFSTLCLHNGQLNRKNIFPTSSFFFKTVFLSSLTKKKNRYEWVESVVLSIVWNFRFYRL